MSVLAENIRLIRTELDCTQSAMAAILKIGFRTYVRYEAGERDAPAAVLVKLARLGSISLEQFLTQVICSHDISPTPTISKAKTFPEVKLVDFYKGKIDFKNPSCHKLITIDSSEKKLLILFRKMNIESQKVFLKNIQDMIKINSSASSLRSLKIAGVKKVSGRFFLGDETNTFPVNNSYPSKKKQNNKLLKEKIERLKMVTNSVSRITVK